MKFKKFIISLIIILAISALLIVFKTSNYLLRQNGEKTDVPSRSVQTNEVKEFIIKAARFNYNPDVIRVKRGEKIKLTIDNLDTTHGIRIPDLKISGDSFVEFIAEKPGEFYWYCNNYCGDGHRQMQGKLIVEE